MRRVPVESSLTKRFGEVAETEERDDLVGARALGALDAPAPGGARA